MKSFSLILLIISLSFTAFVKAENYPLNNAARSQNHKQVENLLLSGVNPNETNQFASTALSGVAGMCGENDIQSLYIARLLLEHGADINQANDQGLTPIAHAAAMGCAGNVYYLLEQGADLYLRSESGWTTLMYAAQSGDKNTVEVLLEAGANPTVKSRAGYDVFYVANKFGDHSLVALLKSYSEKNGQNVVYEYVDCSEHNYDGSKGKNGLIKKCFEKYEQDEADDKYGYDFSMFDDESPLQNNTKDLSQHTDDYDLNWSQFTANGDTSELGWSKALLISFLITWIIILTPVVLVRLYAKSPLTKLEAIVFVLILFFINHIIFAALQSQSKSHAAITIGAMLSYLILRMTTNKKPAELPKEATLPSNERWGGKTISSPSKMIVDKSKRLSKNKKLFFSFSVFWFVWVIVRTFFSFELLGFDFYEWDQDVFFVNLFVPPFLVATFYLVYKWANSDS